MSPTSPPLLLLDVDGVLNALGGSGLAAWPEWRTGRALADGTAWPIRWAPTVVERLRGWHEQGRVELQWLTTWGHQANLGLRGLLDLPELAVAGTYQDEGPYAGRTDHEDAAAHAAVAPAAPDELTGRWWKRDVVRRLVGEQPDRLLLWVDDELHDRPNRYVAWAEQQGVVAVGPDPRTGLSPADLDLLESHLAQPRST